MSIYKPYRRCCSKVVAHLYSKALLRRLHLLPQTYEHVRILASETLEKAEKSNGV